MHRSVVDPKNCKRCALANRLNGESIVPGFGNPQAEIMLVGEAPGQTEALLRKPFVGDAGQDLNELLKAADINRDDLYITNVCKCRPWEIKEHPISKQKYHINRTPLPDEMRSCIEYLHAEIEAIKPKVIITLGGIATSAIEGKKVKITDRMGVPSLYSKSGTGTASIYKTEKRVYVVPTLHPSYISRNGGVRTKTGDLTVMGAQVTENIQRAKDIIHNNVLFHEHRYLIVDNREKLEKVIATAKERKVVAFDIETEGLGFWDRILGVGFAVDIGVACYIPFLANDIFSSGLREFWTGRDISKEDVVSKLKDMMEDPSIQKSAHSSKFDMRGLRREFGISVTNLFWDSMCGAYLLDENTSHKLKDIKNKHIDLLGYEDLYNRETDNGSKPQQASLDVIANYCCGDCDATYRETKSQLSVFLQDETYMNFMTNFYVPLMEFVKDFEYHGVAYDRNRAMQMTAEYTQKAQTLKEDIWRHAGCGPFNPDSPEDLIKVLFNVLGLTHKKRTKTKQQCIDVDVMEDLAKEHIVPKLIIDYRHLNKMRSTYMERFIAESERDGRLHLTTNPIGTVTGRPSSEGLMNIPKEVAVKSLFIAPEGYKLVQADLSQAEVRCFAHYANEKVLRDAFEIGSIDVHCVVASDVNGIPYKEFMERYTAKDPVVMAMRQAAKATVFGILYGRGPKSIAEEHKMSLEDALAFMGKFFARFPNCKRWIDDTIRLVHDTGQVRNVYGRIRRIPAIFSRDPEQVAHAERQAVNSIIQSTASDITCFGLCKVHQHLKNNNIPSRIVLTVYDSIIAETRDDYVDYVGKLMQDVLAAKPHPDFTVRMKADVSVYQKWGEGE